MDFDEIISRIPVIYLYDNKYILPENLQQTTEFVGMGRFTSSTNPIATCGIIPCLGIGISGGGVNFLEHASPRNYVHGGSAITHMVEIIKKFKKYGQTPNVYLFRTYLDREISAVIYQLYVLGLVESGNVFFCNTTNINLTDYVGIYNNKPFWSKNSKNLKKISEISVGDYVMIPNSQDIFVIVKINNFNNINIHNTYPYEVLLYNISKSKNSNDLYEYSWMSSIIKIKRSYANTVRGNYSNTLRGRTTYNIPEDIQKIINNSKNK